MQHPLDAFTDQNSGAEPGGDQFEEKDLPVINWSDPGNWDVVRMPASELAKLPFKTSVCRLTGEREGDVLMVCRSEDRRIGIGFSWGIYQKGIVLVRDLTSITSNVLLEANGALLDLHQHTAYLLTALQNNADWRSQVLYLLDRDNRLAQCMGDNSLPPPEPLSSRECECLRWMGAGKSPEEIGTILDISESTANKHLDAARRKLHCSTRTMAVLRAYRLGWL
jgi:DNA-binding CsgD family transcriptional regulator